MVKSSYPENNFEASYDDECEEEQNWDQEQIENESSEENAPMKEKFSESEKLGYVVGEAHHQLEKPMDEVGEKPEEPQEPAAVEEAVPCEPDPPDGGYGWVIVMAAFISMVLTGGFMKCAGLFFLQFKTRFESGALQAAWPGSAMSTIANFCGPLVAAVCNRYSVRTAVMIGTALMFIGLVMNSMADDYYFLFFCHSFVQGVGLCFISLPGPFLISVYFEKRRGFATAIASSGMGFGTFAIVPLVNFLFDFYGFRGCFLILAAILSNGFMVAMLYRPLSRHYRFLKAKKARYERKALHDENEVDNEDSSCVPLKETIHEPLSGNIGKDLSLPSSEKTSSGNRVWNPPTQYNNNPADVECASLVKQTGRKTEGSSCHQLKSYLKICFPTEHSRKGNKKKQKVFHLNLMKSVSFDFHLCCVVLFVMTAKATYTFIPAACIDKGLSKTDAALILSIVGALDCFGRIGLGFLLDFPRLKPLRPLFFNLFLFGIAIAVMCIPFMTSFVELTVVCSMFGICSGAHISQRPVVLVDLMGKELLASSMGLIKMFQGFGMFLGPLLFGALRDATGAYDIAFYLGSALMTVAGLCLGLSNLVWRFEHRKRNKESQEGSNS